MPQKLIQHSLGFSRESRMDSIMRSSKAIMFNTRTKNKHESNLLEFERKKIEENEHLAIIHTTRDINNERECLSKMLALKKVYQRHSFDKYDPVLHPQKRNRLCHIDARDLMKMWFKGKKAKTETAESETQSLTGSRPASSIFHRMRMASGRSRSRQLSAVSGEGGAWGTLLTETIHEEAKDDTDSVLNGHEKDAIVYKQDDDKTHLTAINAECIDNSNKTVTSPTKDKNSNYIKEQSDIDIHTGQSRKETTETITDEIKTNKTETETSQVIVSAEMSINKIVESPVNGDTQRQATDQTLEQNCNEHVLKDNQLCKDNDNLEQNTLNKAMTSDKSAVENLDKETANHKDSKHKKDSEANTQQTTTKVSKNANSIRSSDNMLQERDNSSKLHARKVEQENEKLKHLDTNKNVKILDKREQMSARANRSQNSARTRNTDVSVANSNKDRRLISREKSSPVIQKSSQLKDKHSLPSRETTTESHLRQEKMSHKKTGKNVLKEGSVNSAKTPGSLKKANTDLDSVMPTDSIPNDTRRSSSASTLKVDRIVVQNAATNNPTNWKGLIHKLRRQQTEAIIDDRVVEAKSTRRLKRREKTFVLSRARTIFPGECKSTFEMRRFFEREVSDLIFSLSPKGRRQTQIELLKERERLPTLIDQSKSTSAILKDFRKYRTEARSLTAP